MICTIVKILNILFLLFLELGITVNEKYDKNLTGLEECKIEDRVSWYWCYCVQPNANFFCAAKFGAFFDEDIDGSHIWISIRKFLQKWDSIKVDA